MIIYFTETESSEHEFFETALPDHDLRFVASPEEVGEDAEALSVFIYTKVDKVFVEAHPKLKLVATRSTGFDHIDLIECKHRDIAVCHVPNYGENTVAEHTFALILALSRRLLESLEPRRGTFSFQKLRGFDLKGKTLGIIGAGRIGLHVIRIARSFGMTVIAFDMQPHDFISEVLDYQYVPLDEILQQSDIISLHAPLNPHTRHLISRETLAKCKPGVLIVNTARGALIDTDALIEALDSGQVGGAGLDVLEHEAILQKDPSATLSAQIIENLRQSDDNDPEPIADRTEEIALLLRNKALIGRTNVIFTPHTAFNSVEAVERINRTTVESIKSYLSGSTKHQIA